MINFPRFQKTRPRLPSQGLAGFRGQLQSIIDENRKWRSRAPVYNLWSCIKTVTIQPHTKGLAWDTVIFNPKEKLITSHQCCQGSKREQGAKYNSSLPTTTVRPKPPLLDFQNVYMKPHRNAKQNCSPTFRVNYFTVRRPFIPPSSSNGQLEA